MWLWHPTSVHSIPPLLFWHFIPCLPHFIQLFNCPSILLLFCVHEFSLLHCLSNFPLFVVALFLFVTYLSPSSHCSIFLLFPLPISPCHPNSSFSTLIIPLFCLLLTILLCFSSFFFFFASLLIQLFLCYRWLHQDYAGQMGREPLQLHGSLQILLLSTTDAPATPSSGVSPPPHPPLLPPQSVPPSGTPRTS